MGSKRPKPHFTEVFAFPKRPKGLVWDAWKSGFQLVFTGLGTLGGMTKNAAENQVLRVRNTSLSRVTSSPAIADHLAVGEGHT